MPDLGDAPVEPRLHALVPVFLGLLRVFRDRRVFLERLEPLQLLEVSARRGQDQFVGLVGDGLGRDQVDGRQFDDHGREFGRGLAAHALGELLNRLGRRMQVEDPPQVLGRKVFVQLAGGDHQLVADLERAGCHVEERLGGLAAVRVGQALGDVGGRVAADQVGVSGADLGHVDLVVVQRHDHRVQLADPFGLAFGGQVGQGLVDGGQRFLERVLDGAVQVRVEFALHGVDQHLADVVEVGGEVEVERDEQAAVLAFQEVLGLLGAGPGHAGLRLVEQARYLGRVLDVPRIPAELQVVVFRHNGV